MLNYKARLLRNRCQTAAEWSLWRVRSIHEMLLRNMDTYQLRITLMDLRPPKAPAMSRTRKVQKRKIVQSEKFSR